MNIEILNTKCKFLNQNLALLPISAPTLTPPRTGAVLVLFPTYPTTPPHPPDKVGKQH